MLVEPEAGMVSPFSALIITIDLLTFSSVRVLYYGILPDGMEKCFLAAPALRIPECGTETHFGSTNDVWPKLTCGGSLQDPPAPH